MSQDPQLPDSTDRVPGEVDGDEQSPAQRRNPRAIVLTWLADVPSAVWFYLGSLAVTTFAGAVLGRLSWSFVVYSSDWYWAAQVQLDTLGGAEKIPWSSPIGSSLIITAGSLFMGSLGLCCLAVLTAMSAWFRYPSFHEWFLFSTRRRWGLWRRVVPVALGVAAAVSGGLLGLWWALADGFDRDPIYFGALFSSATLLLLLLVRWVTRPIVDLADDTRKAAHPTYSGKGDC